MQEFWKRAEASRMEAEFLADHKLRTLQTLPMESLRRIFVQYPTSRSITSLTWPCLSIACPSASCAAYWPSS